NIDADPEFTDSNNGDFTLQSTSPCIDAGDPDLDGDGEDYTTDTDDQDPDGTRADMGAYPVYQEFYELHAGANLISFYALPDDNSIENVMWNLGDNVTGVITEGGASTQTESGSWIGSLTHIFCEKGYWIILDAEATLTVYDAVPCDNEYCVHVGANLISFPSADTVDVGSAIPDDVEECFTGIITEGGASTQISPYNWIGSLTEFQGGKGYWLISDCDTCFSFDLINLSRSNIAYKEEKLSGYEYAQSSKQAFYFVESIEGISGGDYILSFSGDKLIGSRQWQGSIIDIPVMGNDGNSYSNGYMEAGHTPTFKLLSGGKLTTLEGDIPAWSDNGLFMVSSLSQVVIPESYSLSQAYPNPFNPTTTLSFAIPVDNEVTLSIYNLQGREVSTLIDANMDAGYHSIVWDANANASGVYFVKMMAGEYVSTQKLMLIK
ncbi:MAG: T9SS type A sorting domain-containing protein, partial [Anaerolineales bacterium]|nr:T9SS type A sorting domain-containing protein [Anaerolineales bacterium]